MRGQVSRQGGSRQQALGKWGMGGGGEIERGQAR